MTRTSCSELLTRTIENFTTTTTEAILELGDCTLTTNAGQYLLNRYCPALETRVRLKNYKIACLVRKDFDGRSSSWDFVGSCSLCQCDLQRMLLEE